METNRKLIDYLPPFLQEYYELRNIMIAEQPEFDMLFSACEDILSDQFIMSATENGVQRYESMMGITPKDTDNLDRRKFRILTKWNQELPYTMRKLQEALTNLCGEGNFSIDLQNEIYHIEIQLALKNLNDYGEVVNLLEKMIPANLTQHVQIMYNNHEVLSGFTHRSLSAYTHEQLRTSVFEYNDHLIVIDDGNGNLTFYGNLVSVTDDGNGNLFVAGMSATDSGNGNVVIVGG